MAEPRPFPEGEYPDFAPMNPGLVGINVLSFGAFLYLAFVLDEAWPFFILVGFMAAQPFAFRIRARARKLLSERDAEIRALRSKLST